MQSQQLPTFVSAYRKLICYVRMCAKQNIIMASLVVDRISNPILQAVLLHIESNYRVIFNDKYVHFPLHTVCGLLYMIDSVQDNLILRI
jgi:hypothetical protein